MNLHEFQHENRFWKTRFVALLLRRSIKTIHQKNTIMSDHIENEGKKGKFMMWFIIYFVLFIALMIYLYRYNLQLEF